MKQEKKNYGARAGQLVPIIVSILAVFIFIGAYYIKLNVTINAADVSDKNALGTINHYNGLIFGEFTSQRADVEGALAVGGQYAEFGTQDYNGYDIGAAAAGAGNLLGFYNNPNNYPSLLLNTEEISIGAKRGMTPSGSNWYGVYGGKIFLREGLYSQYVNLSPRFNGAHEAWGNDNDVNTVEDTVVAEWFQEAYRYSTAASRQYAKANQVSITLEEFSNGSYLDKGAGYFANQNLVKSGQTNPDQKIIVITVRTGAQLDFDDPAVVMPVSADWAVDNTLVVYNFPDAIKVTGAGGAYTAHIKGFPNAYVNTPYSSLAGTLKTQRLALCSKVIWNFPKAEDIEFEEFQLYGSVLAPYAHFTGNGSSLNGQLICKNFTQNDGFELHGYPLDDEFFNVVDPDDDEEEAFAMDVKVTKYLYYGGQRDVTLEGAEFQLFYEGVNGLEEYQWPDAGGTQPPLITNQQGEAWLRELPAGKYQLVETKAPDYMKLNQTDQNHMATYYQYWFEVKESGENSQDDYSAIDAQGNLCIARYNEPALYDLEFVKTDEQGIPLKGAVFSLSREADDFLEGFIIHEGVVSQTDGTLIFSGLPAGRYRLAETQAPDGYQAGTDIIFQVDKEGKLQLEASPLVNQVGGQVQIINKKLLPGAFMIEKHLTKAAVRQEEFIFRVRYEGPGEMKEFYGVVTIAKGEKAGMVRFEHMPPGTYTVFEKDTNWRFGSADQEQEQTFSLSGGLEEAIKLTFTNEEVNDKWLSDKNSIVNKMKSLETD